MLIYKQCPPCGQLKPKAEFAKWSRTCLACDALAPKAPEESLLKECADCGQAKPKAEYAPFARHCPACQDVREARRAANSMRCCHTCGEIKEKAEFARSSRDCASCDAALEALRVAGKTPPGWTKRQEKRRRHRIKYADKIREDNRRRRRARPESAINAGLRATNFTRELCADAAQIQGGRCGICSATFSESIPRHVHADHDHVSGAPRGLLCTYCNTGLGQFKDNPEFLAAAVAYLKNPPLSLV